MTNVAVIAPRDEPHASPSRFGHSARHAESLADGGFNSNEEIDSLNNPSVANSQPVANSQVCHGTKLYVPVKDVDKKRKKGLDPFAPRRPNA